MSKKRRGGGKRSRRTKFGQVSKACFRKGHKPGTKAFGSCMKAGLKK
jgi:hypothetical protein